MKKIIYISGLILYSFSIYAQSVNAVWSTNHGGNSFERAQDIVSTSDDGQVIVGHTRSSNNGDIGETIDGSQDIWVVKLDSSGNILWEHTYGGNSGGEVAFSISNTSDGGFIVAGQTTSSESGDVTGVNNGLSDMWLLKLDSNGIIEWERNFGTASTDIAYSVIQTNDSGYLMCGTTQVGTSFEASVVKYSENGDFEWSHLYGGSGSEIAWDAVQLLGGDYIIAGEATSINGDLPTDTQFFNDNYWIFRIDSSGALIWSKVYGGTSSDTCKSIILTNDNNLVFAGFSASQDFFVSNANGSKDVWLIKTDLNGDLIWESSFGGSNVDEAVDIIENPDGSFVVAGFTFSIDGDVMTNVYDRSNYWVFQADSSGNLQWEQVFGGDDFEEARALTRNNDGSYTITGFSDSNDGDVLGNNGDEDIWTLRMEANNLETVEFKNPKFNIFPNPTTDYIEVEAVNKINAIEIYDILGKLVHKTQSIQRADISHLSEGQYIIKVSHDFGNAIFRVIKK